MKKIYVLLLTTPLVLVGCKKDDDACNGLDIECRLSATWSGKLYQEETDGEVIIPVKSTEVGYQDELSDEITFYNDGTYESQEVCPGTSWFYGGSGTWYYQDGIVYIDGDEYNLDRFTGKEMTLRYVESGYGKATGYCGVNSYILTFELKKDGPTELVP